MGAPPTSDETGLASVTTSDRDEHILMRCGPRAAAPHRTATEPRWEHEALRGGERLRIADEVKAVRSLDVEHALRNPYRTDLTPRDR